MAPLISFKDFTFTYSGGKCPAVKHIQADLESPTSLVVMGHGGAGKSTLCYSLNAIVPKFFRGSYQGKVLVKGKEASHHLVSEMSRVVGLVFQDFEAQLFSTTVELEMAFGLENHALPRPEMERRINHYLTVIGLSHFRDREPASLSGGQKQRLAIGSVLAMEPEVLVMDEPTTDLDPAGREEVLSLIERSHEQNRLLLIVDHEPDIALSADQVWLMRGGEIVARGSPAEILSNVSALNSCGIKPPPTIELFQQMGWPGKPLTVESAIHLIEKHHLTEAQKDHSLTLSQVHRGSPILLTEGLKYTYPYPPVEALKGVDLSIEEGEFIAILGQNGSGKTTLAKHFNGLLKPSAGRILVQGKPTKDMSHREMAQFVGYVFQNPDHQIFANTVREEIGFGLKVMGNPPQAIARRVSEALRTVGLEGYEEKNPFALSKGERQRIAVASVLATQPRMIILDEPTTGLDYLHQKNLMEMLKHLNQKGHTIVIITHCMWVAAEYASRTILMKDGFILADGETRAIFADEALLKQASLRPPPLVKLSNWLGTKAMTMEKMVEELKIISKAKPKSPHPLK